MLDAEPQSPGGGTDTLAAHMAKSMAALIRWREQIEKALSHVHGMYSFDDVTAMVLQNHLRVYVADDHIILMQHNQFPRWSAYHCFVACGDMEAIKVAEAEINEHAKALGCKYMSISGRVGWPRALKSAGWEHLISDLFKETY